MISLHITLDDYTLVVTPNEVDGGSFNATICDHSLDMAETQLVSLDEIAAVLSIALRTDSEAQDAHVNQQLAENFSSYFTGAFRLIP
jgi:hypothetical protein